MKKTIIFLLIGLASALISLGFYRSSPQFIQQVELRLKDARFRIRGPLKPPDSVVIVAVDNKSVKEIGRWPWSREIMGKLFSGIAKHGAKVTALDVVFSEPQGPKQDKALADGITEAGNIVMGYFFRNEEQKIDPRTIEQLENSKIKLLKVDDDVKSIPLTDFSSVDANIAEVAAGALDFGFFNAVPSLDGVFRKAPLLLLFNGDMYPSLPLKALRYYLDSEIMVDVASFGIRTLAIGQRTIPVSETGELTLNFYGKGNSFQQVSAVDIIKERLPKDILKGKLVLVGTTEIGIGDIRATPFDPALPGVEIHATVASNAIDNRYLLHDARTITIELAAILILPLILALLLSFASGTLVGLTYSGITSACYALVNFYLFKNYLLDIAILYPFIALVTTHLGAEAYRNLVIEKKGRYMKKAFTNYISADLVAEIMKNPDRLKLGGEKRVISILFSDIRGFTTLSESLTPEDLVTLLNEYLSPMTRIVMEEHGTLDKYIGDAVMAIYNAPLDVEDHPKHACLTALKMIKKLEELNQSFTARGMLTIDIGVGINTGDAVVGNMGADIRFDYTAIGDNVNLASRLEGLNKMYGTHILVSGSTREMVNDPSLVFREVDLVRVKGKNLPIPIFELMVKNTEVLDDFATALKLYKSMQFEQAKSIFSRLAEEHNDATSKMYVGRCDEFLHEPPPDEWDGVFVAKSK
jgi:adenylate cyclase